MAVLRQTVADNSDSIDENEYPTPLATMNAGSKRTAESDTSKSKKTKQDIHENPMDVEIEKKKVGECIWLYKNRSESTNKVNPRLSGPFRDRSRGFREFT